MIEDTDELASALVDGELTGQARDRALADAAVASRADTFERIAAAVSKVSPAAEAALVDEHISRALDHFDASSEVVEHLAPRRRSLRSGNPIRVIAAAAAVVVVVAAGSLATRGDDEADLAARVAQTAEDGTSGSDAGSAAQPGPEVAAPTAAMDSGGGGASGGGSSAGRPTFATSDELDRFLLELLGPTAVTESDPGSGSSAGAAAGGATGSCDAVIAAGADPNRVVLTVAVVLAGADVVAVVAEDDPRTVTLVDEATCAAFDAHAL